MKRLAIEATELHFAAFGVNFGPRTSVVLDLSFMAVARSVDETTG
jgi:hypothetical protein